MPGYQFEFLKMPSGGKFNFRLFKTANIISACAILFVLTTQAEDFTNSLAEAALAEKHGDLQAALIRYGNAEKLASNNAVNLCRLSRGYCELTYLTNSPAIQKTLLQAALACARQAVKADPRNAAAHASVAVCYAKSCPLYDLKTQLVYARLFKAEAERTIALARRQDIAYYLLGRWNYGIANAGWLSRTYVKVVYGGLPQASNEAAIKNFKEASRLAPDRIINYQGLALAYEATGQKNLEVAALKKCWAMKPVDREDAVAQTEAKQKLLTIRP
jgi:tetratricopeptide (TPR) repeat protein